MKSASLLGLEEKDRAVSEVEVNEVLGFCTGLSGGSRFDGIILPCVTKLPKFLPTTQCHVAPLRESN